MANISAAPKVKRPHFQEMTVYKYKVTVILLHQSQRHIYVSNGKLLSQTEKFRKFLPNPLLVMLPRKVSKDLNAVPSPQRPSRSMNAWKKIIPLHQFFRYQLWWTILPSFAMFNPIPLPFHTIILPTLPHSLILFSQHQTLPWHWSLKPTPASLIILAMHICIMLVVYCKVNYKT